MVNNNLILGVIFFLIGMAVLAGIGIGLVIGLALGGSDDSVERPAAPPRSVEPVVPLTSPATSVSASQVDFARPTTTGGLQPVPVAGAEAARPARRVPSWSVALAIGVIVVCCCCTFLLAALSMMGS